MITASESFSRDLQSLILKIVPGASGIVGLHRLSAGATLQTWSFDVVAGDRLLHPMILRRSPDGLRTSESVPLEVEAEVIRALARSGVPVAAVVHTLTQEDSLGEGFLMVRVDGETIPRKILRDPQFAQVRLGGLGSRDQLYEAYEAETGESVDRARVHWWEVLGSLRWGVSCAGMLDWFASGRDPTVERAMIAPRVSESELDLLRILTGSN